MGVKSFGLTDIGKVRKENQDTFIADDSIGLYMVADGMGGMQQGLKASVFAAHSIYELVKKNIAAISEEINIPCTKTIEGIVKHVNSDMREQIGKGAGTTVVFVIIFSSNAMVVNTGDSPSYLFRDGAMEKLTKDHNIAQVLLDLGKITEEQAARHPLRHYLNAYIGMEKVDMNIRIFDVNRGDRILLCSDGLIDMVEKDKIAQILYGERSTEKAAFSLIERANDEGGYDNITAVIVDLV